jgi:hypothetical protein
LRGVSKDRRMRACGHPSRLAEDGERLRMTAVLICAKLAAINGDPIECTDAQ